MTAAGHRFLDRAIRKCRISATYLSVLRVPFRDPPLRRRLEIVKTESDQWRAYRKADHQ